MSTADRRFTTWSALAQARVDLNEAHELLDSITIFQFPWADAFASNLRHEGRELDAQITTYASSQQKRDAGGLDTLLRRIDDFGTDVDAFATYISRHGESK